MRTGKNSILLSLLFSLAILGLYTGLTSCKKDKQATITGEIEPSPPQTYTVVHTAAPIPTVYPSSRYLPAYPGSYWVFKVNGGPATVTLTTSPEYVHDSVNTSVG